MVFLYRRFFGFLLLFNIYVGIFLECLLIGYDISMESFLSEVEKI